MKGRRMAEVEKFDVIVIGGGTAGVVAAVQAGRAGARTLLVEKNGIVGGTTAAAGVDFPGLFHAWKRQVIAGIGWELVTQCAGVCGMPLPDFSMQGAEPHHRQQVRINRAIFPSICMEALCNAGVELYLHTMVARIARTAGRWTVTVCTKTGLADVSGLAVIDASGDANAASLAGFAVIEPPVVQPATLVCHASGYDPASIDYAVLKTAFDAAVAAGRLKHTDIGWRADRFDPKWVRHCGENASHISGINAATSAGKTKLELEARASLLRLFRFLRGQPGFEQLRLDYVAQECGVRETRVIAGQQTVTAQDYLSGRVWDDALCYSFYPIDLHTSDHGGLDCRPLREGVVPTIPRGALLPQGGENFIVAGRCLSSDRTANSALRVQASCMAMGQAAGAMAALAASTGLEVSRLPLAQVCALLRQHGAITPEPAGAFSSAV